MARIISLSPTTRCDMKYAQIVNREHPYNPEDYKKFKMKKVKNVNNDLIWIESKTYRQFLKLKKKLKHENVVLGIKYAYRSEEEQKKLYKTFCSKYGNDYANRVVCPVGLSEHHTGLALDIEIYLNGKWISNNENPEIAFPLLEKFHPYLAKFGFIVRFPKLQSRITGMPYEPWHIRYVGKTLAKTMSKYNLVLEDLCFEIAEKH